MRYHFKYFLKKALLDEMENKVISSKSAKDRDKNSRR